mgnify:CR=1 FL=1
MSRTRQFTKFLEIRDEDREIDYEIDVTFQVARFEDQIGFEIDDVEIRAVWLLMPVETLKHDALHGRHKWSRHSCGWPDSQRYPNFMKRWRQDYDDVILDVLADNSNEFWF